MSKVEEKPTAYICQDCREWMRRQGKDFNGFLITALISIIGGVSYPDETHECDAKIVCGKAKDEQLALMALIFKMWGFDVQ